MSTLEVGKFEIVTPILTVLGDEELRMPEPGEVLLAHGITIGEDRETKMGKLVLSPKPVMIEGPFTSWHYDMIHTQAHLTEEGELEIKLAGIKGELLTPKQVGELSEALDSVALKVDIFATDLLVFNGFRAGMPIAHSVLTKSASRRSHFFPIQIS